MVPLEAAAAPPPTALNLPPLTAPPNGKPSPRPASARRRPGRVGKAARYFSFVALVAALGWGGVKWGLPGKKGPDVVTAVAVRGNLVINVTERGELESSKS